MIAPFRKGDVVAEVADDQDGIDLRALGEGGIDIGLQGHELAAAHAAVGGDDYAARAILDPAVQGLGREAAEHDRVDGADAGAGEHRHRGLRDHRHVEGDAVPLAGAERLEAVRHRDDLAVELAVADRPAGAGFVAFEQEGGLIRAAGEVPVHAIVAEVEHPVLEPFDVDGVERPVGDARGELVPIDPPRLAGPETVGIVARLAVQPVVIRGVGVGRGDERLGRQNAVGHGLSSRPN